MAGQERPPQNSLFAASASRDRPTFEQCWQRLMLRSLQWPQTSVAPDSAVALHINWLPSQIVACQVWYCTW